MRGRRSFPKVGACASGFGTRSACAAAISLLNAPHCRSMILRGARARLMEAQRQRLCGRADRIGALLEPLLAGYGRLLLAGGGQGGTVDRRRSEIECNRDLVEQSVDDS